MAHRESEIMLPIYEHIRKDIFRRHPDWKELIDNHSENKYERYKFAKKLVRESIRETKERYMRDSDVSFIASQLVFRRSL